MVCYSLNRFKYIISTVHYGWIVLNYCWTNCGGYILYTFLVYCTAFYFCYIYSIIQIEQFATFGIVKKLFLCCINNLQWILTYKTCLFFNTNFIFEFIQIYITRRKSGNERNRHVTNLPTLSKKQIFIPKNLCNYLSYRPEIKE
jgi:hypothetical protein